FRHQCMYCVIAPQYTIKSLNGLNILREQTENLQPLRHHEAWHHRSSEGGTDQHHEGGNRLSLLLARTKRSNGKAEARSGCRGNQCSGEPGRKPCRHVKVVEQSGCDEDQRHLHHSLECEEQEL